MSITSGESRPSRQDARDGSRCTVVESLRGGLTVSCQASRDSPMDDPEVIAAVAAAAELGGAAGLRIDSAEHVRAVRERSGLPVIGLQKVPAGDERPFITPTRADCEQLAEAGADILAIEGSHDRRSEGELADLIRFVHEQLGLPVMADVATLTEGLEAWDAGAELIGTTLSGYTSATSGRSGPDLGLVANLAQRGVRTVLEGRVRQPSVVAEGFERGAWTVVVGSAITDPLLLTMDFARAAPEATSPKAPAPYRPSTPVAGSVSRTAGP